jgi:hypothetical protein
VNAWPAFDARQWAPGPIHVRTDLGPGRKQVWWRARDGRPGLGGHDLADLVYLPGGRLTMPARVVITEGERAADALEAAGVHAIATVCGAATVPGPSFARLLTGVRVTLWPDADAQGWAHMCRVSRLLEPVVASMAVIVRPTGIPSGWDAADARPAEVRRLVATAQDVWLRPR